jgi:2-dehydro-3-deoxyphosphogluconate aldolase / (4S)-4-hydroxy-2-oxoglutarate aldolase
LSELQTQTALTPFLWQGSAQQLAVIRGQTPEDAIWLAEQLAMAGFTMLELTFTTPDVLQAVKALQKRFSQEGRQVRLGLGSILTLKQLELAAEAGACFFASPGWDAELWQASQVLGLNTYWPGVSTPSETMQALKQGATTLKLFPCKALGGLAALKALQAPFPQVAWLPFGGLTPSCVPAYLQAGALAVGLGQSLMPPHPNWLAQRQYETYQTWLVQQLREAQTQAL